MRHVTGIQYVWIGVCLARINPIDHVDGFAGEKNLSIRRCRMLAGAPSGCIAGACLIGGIFA